MILDLDYSDKEFICFYDGQFYQPNTLTNLLNEASYSDLSEFKDIKWLMWTGLTDINYRKVYEGDICMFDGHIGVVMFERGTFYTDVYSDFDPLHGMKSINRLGSFLTHPELQGIAWIEYWDERAEEEEDGSGMSAKELILEYRKNGSR